MKLASTKLKEQIKSLEEALANKELLINQSSKDFQPIIQEYSQKLDEKDKQIH